MSERGSCFTCVFYEDILNDVGMCRRYAPRPAPYSLYFLPDGEEELDAFWPHTRSYDWCGEHSPKPDSGAPESQGDQP